jgi:protein-tyrosine phosphatase
MMNLEYVKMLHNYAYDVIELLQGLRDEEYLALYNTLDTLKYETEYNDINYYEEEDFDEVVDFMDTVIDDYENGEKENEELIAKYVKYIEEVRKYVKVFKVYK